MSEGKRKSVRRSPRYSSTEYEAYKAGKENLHAVPSKEQVAEQLQRFEPQVSPVHEDIISMKVGKLAVTNDRSYGEAGRVLCRTVNIKRSLEEQRKFFLAPLKEAVRRIESQFRKINKPCLELERYLRDEIGEYLDKHGEESRKEAKKEAVYAKAAGNEPLVRTLIDVADATQCGPPVEGLYIVGKRVWTYVNKKKLPEKFWKKIPNEELIDSIVKAQGLGAEETLEGAIRVIKQHRANVKKTPL
jgi:hypothetical protein